VVSKDTVFGLLVLTTAAVGVLAAYFVGMTILEASDAATVSLGDPNVPREMFGMAAYITAIALIGVGLGVVLRSVAGSIGAVVAGVIILPALAGALLPESWDPLLQYFPSSAAAAFTTVLPAGDETLSATAGAVTLVGWILAALVGAVLSLTRRDV
jgi:ABC-2 type transport system permease protein